MKTARLLIVAALLVGVCFPLAADTRTANWENRLKEAYNDLAMKVRSTETPAEKRALLNDTLERLLAAVDRMERLPDLSENQLEAIARYRKDVQDLHDELNGLNGFPRVADSGLDGFAGYMVQSLEQAESYFVISGLGLLLIIIILILIL
jgi:septal ring factor EnvC (AmiA/AmiB activator)